MKVSIQHQTAEYGAKLMKKGKTYNQITLTVTYTPEEAELMKRGGLANLVICEAAMPAHLDDTLTDPLERHVYETGNTITAGKFLGNEPHVHTFRSLLAARNFEADFITGLKKLKDTIGRDIADPFQPSKTLEI